MESNESGNEEMKGKNNSNKYIMSLLYAQTKELQKQFHSDMEVSPMPYYLVDKEWLDNFKKKNDYKSIAQNLNSFNDYNDYDDFREKIRKSLEIEQNNKIKNEEKYNPENDSKKKEKNEKYNLTFNMEGELVSYQFIRECFNDVRCFRQRDAIVGNETILITDEDNDNVVYSYSLVESSQNINDFYIKVENALMFDSSITIGEEFGNIADCKGINNYLNKNKIDALKNEEQEIFNNKGQKIGIVLNLKKSPIQQNIAKPFGNNNGESNPISDLSNINNQMQNPQFLNNIISNDNNYPNNMNNNMLNNNFNPINQGISDINSNNLNSFGKNPNNINNQKNINNNQIIDNNNQINNHSDKTESFQYKKQMIQNNNMNLSNNQNNMKNSGAFKQNNNEMDSNNQNLFNNNMNQINLNIDNNSGNNSNQFKYNMNNNINQGNNQINQNIPQNSNFSINQMNIFSTINPGNNHFKNKNDNQNELNKNQNSPPNNQNDFYNNRQNNNFNNQNNNDMNDPMNIKDNDNNDNIHSNNINKNNNNIDNNNKFNNNINNNFNTLLSKLFLIIKS